MSRPKLAEPVYRLVQREGRNSWYIRWTGADGKSEIVSTGESDRQAAQRVLEDFARERREPAKDLGGIIDGYVDSRRHKASHGHLLSYARQLRMRLGALGCTQLRHVTPTVIADYIAGRGNRITVCRRELELFRAATGIKVQMPAKRPAKVRAIDRDAGLALLRASQGHLRLFVLIALTTGRRTSAILDLTWDRVDLARGVIDFRNPDKGESNKRRGLSPIALPLKKALREAKIWAETGHVIEYMGKPIRDIRKAWWWAMKRAGLGIGQGRSFKPAFSRHALKHSAISWLAELDHSVDRISDMTDTDPKTVKLIYRRVNPRPLQGLADDLGSILRPAVRKTGGKRRF